MPNVPLSLRENNKFKAGSGLWYFLNVIYNPGRKNLQNLNYYDRIV